MKELRDFYNDVTTRENVKAYLTDFLKEEAIRKVFAKEDVSAVSEAKELIDRAWENMEYIFQPTPKKTNNIKTR